MKTWRQCITNQELLIAKEEEKINICTFVSQKKKLKIPLKFVKRSESGDIRGNVMNAHSSKI